MLTYSLVASKATLIETIRVSRHPYDVRAVTVSDRERTQSGVPPLIRTGGRS